MQSRVDGARYFRNFLVLNLRVGEEEYFFNIQRISSADHICNENAWTICVHVCWAG